MSFYFVGEEWKAEDFIIGSALSFPGLAPWTVPYYLKTGTVPSKTQAVIGLYAGIAWGALSRGGSLFINAQSTRLMIKSLPVLAAGEALYRIGEGYVRSAEHQGIGSPAASGFGLSPTQAMGLLSMTWDDIIDICSSI